MYEFIHYGSLMKKLSNLLILVFLFLSTTNVIAACEYKYDWQSGNTYTVCSNYGNTTINGYNSSTGSSWSQTQNSNGTYSGRDSNNNYYNGDNNSGYYYNQGTGKTCYGQGIYRRCY